MVPFIFIHFVTRTFFSPLSDNSVNQILPSVDNVPWATLAMAFLTLLPPARDRYTYFTCYTYVILYFSQKIALLPCQVSNELDIPRLRRSFFIPTTVSWLTSLTLRPGE